MRLFETMALYDTENRKQVMTARCAWLQFHMRVQLAGYPTWLHSDQDLKRGFHTRYSPARSTIDCTESNTHKRRG